MSSIEIKDDIIISEKAVNEIKRIKTENNIPEHFGLRVGVKGGGCSGFTYTLGFDEKENPGDTLITKDNVKVFVDGKSLFYLLGCELDFSGGLNGKGFVFNNPNATRTCGCGESFGV